MDTTTSTICDDSKPRFSRFRRRRRHRDDVSTEGGGGSGSGNGDGDALDELHFGSSSSCWDSIACACPSSGTILHFLSLSSSEEEENVKAKEEEGIHRGEECDDDDVGNLTSPLRLIAIHGSHSDSVIGSDVVDEDHDDTHRRRRLDDALVECRRRLAGAIRHGGRDIDAATETTTTKTSGSPSLVAAVVARARGLLAHATRVVAGRRIDPDWIMPTLGISSPSFLDLTPILLFPRDDRVLRNSSPPSDDIGGGLRELVLPYSSHDPSSLREKLTRSSLYRPLSGLYQCIVGSDIADDGSTTNGGGMRSTTTETTNPGLILRPLPAADGDMRLSPPALIFRCKSLSGARELIEGGLGGRTHKIGWRGHGRPGSLIVSHPSVMGIEIRIRESSSDGGWALSSSFDESQESLLAGSVAELQSTHVTSEGWNDDTTSVRGDAKIGKGDCWVEFRSNATRPAGFVNSLLKTPSKTSVAKPPNIPYD